jgi:hypothetical protein
MAWLRDDDDDDDGGIVGIVGGSSSSSSSIRSSPTMPLSDETKDRIQAAIGVGKVKTRREFLSSHLFDRSH